MKNKFQSWGYKKVRDTLNIDLLIVSFLMHRTNIITHCVKTHWHSTEAGNDQVLSEVKNWTYWNMKKKYLVIRRCSRRRRMRASAYDSSNKTTWKSQNTSNNTLASNLLSQTYSLLFFFREAQHANHKIQNLAAPHVEVSFWTNKPQLLLQAMYTLPLYCDFSGNKSLATW